MNYILFVTVCTVSVFLGMLLFLAVGRRLGIRRRAHETEGAATGARVVEGAVFGLLGLLVAFTFSGAAARFDIRRQLIVEETNAIGTAYLRLDLLPTASQPALRARFRQYVEARLTAYRKLPDIAAAQAEETRATQVQGDIWRQAVAAGQEAGSPQAMMLLLPALNAMINLTTTRTLATRMHPPTLIFGMLFGLALASALLAGYGMAGTQSHRWLHMLVFAAVIALAVYVILDLEFPRLGLIPFQAFDQALADLLESMR
jgi:hypothetical protein